MATEGQKTKNIRVRLARLKDVISLVSDVVKLLKALSEFMGLFDL